jgi:hypothetical protein
MSTDTLLGMSAARMAMGVHAVQLPINLIFQEVDDGDKFAGVFQLNHPGVRELLQGAKNTHNLLMGDMIIRPHLIIGTEHMKGHGANGVYTSGWYMDDWVREGKVLFRLPQ